MIDASKTLAAIFQCVPPHKFWSPSTPGHCGSSYVMFLIISILAFITDFIILVMPLPYIWKLQMKLRQKLLLSIVFTLGALYDTAIPSAAEANPYLPDCSASVSSIIRLWAFMTRDYASPDLTYTAAKPALWSCVEASLAISAACLPSSWPVFTAIGTTLAKLKTKLSKRCVLYRSRRIDSHGGWSKSISNVTRIRRKYSDTGDNATLHPGATMMQSTSDCDTSRTRSNDIGNDQSELSND